MHHRPFKEFASPPPTRRSKRAMPPAQAASAVVTHPGIADSPVLSVAVEVLSTLPKPRQNLLMRHLVALLNMDPAECAAVVQRVQPYLTLDQLAAFCGKSERQMRRYLDQQIRQAFDEAKARRQQTTYLPTEIAD